MTKTKYTSEDYLLMAEKRFKEYADIDEDISVCPLRSHLNTSIETNKDKSKEFGEVFTPLWLVDGMIGQVRNKLKRTTTTLDLCAGYGQFSIRLLRRLFNKHGDKFDCKEYLVKNHSFSELQLTSCHKLLRTFGPFINLFIGDAKELPKLPEVASGVWCYIEAMGGWVPITKTVKSMVRYSEEAFVDKLELIIKGINKGFKKMKTDNLNVKYNSETRLHELKMLDDALNELNPKNPSTRTPTSVVNDMLKDVEIEDKKKILALFNAEIIEGLVYSKKISRDNIVFGVDEANKARATFVNKMYGVDTIIWKDNLPKSIKEALKNKRFNLVLSNPPYSRGLDLKILKVLLDCNIADEYMVVHPATFLLDQKNISHLFIKIKETLANKIKSVVLFNGNTIFDDVGLFVHCSVTHIDVHYGSPIINVKMDKKSFNVNSIDDITKFGSQWESVVKPFLSKIKHTITNNGHVWSHNQIKIKSNISEDDIKNTYCQLAAIRGNVNTRDKNNLNITTDDFYTMTIGTDDSNKGVRERRLDKPGGHTPTFCFKTEVERNNFLFYLNTDFARFCLSLYKIGQHLENGELEIVPWFDFTEGWDDDKLFSHLDIDKDTQTYIRDFLPDYYGIRNNSGPGTDMEKFKNRVLKIAV